MQVIVARGLLEPSCRERVVSLHAMAARVDPSKILLRVCMAPVCRLAVETYGTTSIGRNTLPVLITPAPFSERRVIA